MKKLLSSQIARKLAMLSGATLFAVISMATQANENDTAFVTALTGKAIVQGVQGGESFDIVPFSKLRVNDPVVILDPASQITLVYITNGRREIWKGPAQFSVGIEKSKALQGRPQTVSKIPASLARQLANTPKSTGSGRVGMVRLRSINPLKLREINSKYINYKRSQLPGELNAEIYKLNTLYNLKEWDMMKDFIAELNNQHPDNPMVFSLSNKYLALIDAANPVVQ